MSRPDTGSSCPSGAELAARHVSFLASSINSNARYLSTIAPCAEGLRIDVLPVFLLTPVRPSIIKFRGLRLIRSS
jgi:hypothetical protein